MKVTPRAPVGVGGHPKGSGVVGRSIQTGVRVRSGRVALSEGREGLEGILGGSGRSRGPPQGSGGVGVSPGGPERVGISSRRASRGWEAFTEGWEGRARLGGPFGWPVGIESPPRRAGRNRRLFWRAGGVGRPFWRAGRGREGQERYGVPPAVPGWVGRPFRKTERAW